jgi:hypothetical protein
MIMIVIASSMPLSGVGSWSRTKCVISIRCARVVRLLAGRTVRMLRQLIKPRLSVVARSPILD